MKTPSRPASPQLGFGFDEPAVAALAVQPTAPSPAPRPAPSPEPVQALPTAKAQALVAPEAPVTAAGPSPEAEAMAQVLEAHPDYRVLRRLVPQRVFPAATTGPVVTVLLLDTETTGLNAARDKVVELALLRVQVDLATGQPVGPLEIYDGLEDPGIPMPDEIIAVTGITDDMLRGQKLDEALVLGLLEGVDLVMAHNAAFDRPFVEARLPQFAALNWACSFADIDWKQEGRGSAKLTALAGELGLFYDAHRAEMDCHALLAVLMAPLPSRGISGLSQLIESALTPTLRVLAVNAPFDAKEQLKSRGYRWDAGQKVWHTRLANAAAFELECSWLKSAVYGGRSSRIQFESLDAQTRYSGRPGTLAWREL